MYFLLKNNLYKKFKIVADADGIYAKSKLDKLIKYGIVIKEYKRIGCCFRSVVRFTGEEKYFYYGKSLSKILLDKTSRPIYNNMVSDADKKGNKKTY